MDRRPRHPSLDRCSPPPTWRRVRGRRTSPPSHRERDLAFGSGLRRIPGILWMLSASMLSNISNARSKYAEMHTLPGIWRGLDSALRKPYGTPRALDPEPTRWRSRHATYIENRARARSTFGTCASSNSGSRSTRARSASSPIAIPPPLRSSGVSSKRAHRYCGSQRRIPPGQQKQVGLHCTHALGSSEEVAACEGEGAAFKLLPSGVVTVAGLLSLSALDSRAVSLDCTVALSDSSAPAPHAAAPSARKRPRIWERQRRCMANLQRNDESSTALSDSWAL